MTNLFCMKDYISSAVSVNTFRIKFNYISGYMSASGLVLTRFGIYTIMVHFDGNNKISYVNLTKIMSTNSESATITKYSDDTVEISTGVNWNSIFCVIAPSNIPFEYISKKQRNNLITITSVS